MTKSMFDVQKLNKSFWEEADSNAVYTRNWCSTKTLLSIIPKETWSGRRPCIAHMRVFGCIVYVMMSDGKRRKKKTHTHTHIDAKDTKCLCFGYCKASKHIDSCVWILQNRDVVFMEYSTSVGNDLEMSPRGRNKALMAIRQIF